MRGRRLATVEQVVAVVSPDCAGAIDRLSAWTDANGIDLSTVDAGDDVGVAWDERLVTLGVTVGGDGTFLEGVKQFAPRDVPVLGLSTEATTFLVRVDVESAEAALAETIQGRAAVEERQQIAVEGPDLDATGINDAVVQSPSSADPTERTLTTLDVFADGTYVGEYHGTGLAVSTPTGSTGVSLSAKGPVHNPRDNSTLQVVPLLTHRMGVRPLVVGADTEIEVVAREAADLLVDGGRHHASLAPAESVAVTGAETRAKVVRTSQDADFYTAISERLGWGLRGTGTTRPPARRGAGVDAGGDGATNDATDDADENGVDPATLELEHACRVAVEAVESVREPLRELHGRVESVTFKSDKADIVTEADYVSENIITTALANEFPTHNIRSEEDVRVDRGGSFTWLVDPLDGTGNYAHGNPNYAVSVALLRDGEPVVGVVYAPENDELWTAIRGETPTRDGQPIAVTDRTDLDESMLISGYDPDGAFLSHFYQRVRGVRRLGSAALHLCYLASGSADAIWEYDTYPWDVAAGVVIAEAAGARLTDTEGARFDPTGGDDRRPLVGTNGHLHDELLERLHRSDELA